MPQALGCGNYVDTDFQVPRDAATDVPRCPAPFQASALDAVSVSAALIRARAASRILPIDIIRCE